ncbi:TonB-dependent receptor [Mucilaginibacter sp.]|uniref:TonB-dependent receptor n=1 Tax=Mucilaginibacter sp. TaxID=1882438 RepID=UPI0035650DB7
MRLSYFLCLISFMQVSAASIAQKINLDKNNASLRETLNDIRHQSGYSIFYDVDLISKASNIDVHVKNASIEDALKQCFANQPFDYKIKERTILIIPKADQTLKAPVELAVTITGKVTDDHNQPLPGATVRVKDSPTAVATNNDGLFKITAPNEQSILVFSMIGYETQEITIGKNISLNIVLKEQNTGLNEIVVVGFGTQKKKDLTGAVSSLKKADIENQATPNILTAIAGQMPGVDVKQSDATPGGNPVIRIRGTGSLGGGGASNAPLYVVDGIPLEDATGINAINSSDIESIDVLKDAASAAIYGARGGNGIILITTKKGKLGNPTIDFAYSSGLQVLPKQIEVLNRDQNIQYMKELTAANWASVGGNPATPNGSRTFSGSFAPYNYIPAFDNPDTIANTNWQNEIYHRAIQSNYQVGVQGGSEKFKYFASGNYYKQDGIIRRTGFDRYTARVNIESTISKTVKMGLNFTPSYTKNNNLPTNGHWSGAPGGEAVTISTSLLMPPTIPARYPNGLYGMTEGYQLYYNTHAYNRYLSPIQPIYEQAYRNTSATNRYLGTVYIDVTPLKNLSFRSSIGMDWRATENSFYHPSTVSSAVNGVLIPSFPGTRASNIVANESKNTYRTISWDNTVNYRRLFDKYHDVTFVGGYSVQQFHTEGVSVAGQANTFINDLVPSPAGASIRNGNYSASEYALIGFFGRLSYSYKGKYLLSGSLRNDASSRFPEVSRHGWFPAISAGWRINEESFFKAINFVSDLKLRVSYGVTGNYPTNLYPYQAVLNQLNYNFNDVQAGGLVPSGILNDKLTWETNKQVNIGFDVGVFNNRINFSLDYYKRNTTNLLYTIPIPAISGYVNTFGNVGEIENKGLELNLSSVNIKTSNFTWGTNFNIGGNQNKIVHLGTNDADIITTGDNPLVTILRVGQPLGMFYGYKTAGIFMNQADVLANPSMKFNASSGPGDTKFVDVDGNGTITPNDRTLLGNPAPKFTYGITNNFKYKDFDLSIQLQGLQGGKTFFLLERFIATGLTTSNQLSEYALNRWKSDAEPGDGIMPRAQIQARGPSVGLSESSLNRWLYDGTYLRVRNIALGYNIPGKYIKKLGLRSVRAVLTAQNVYTFTKYIGYSPDSNHFGEQASVQSVDYGVYPQARVFTFGLNVGL